MRLLVAIIVYNEDRLSSVLDEMIEARKAATFPWDVLIVDDGSTDGVLPAVMPQIRALAACVFRHDRNMGVGAGIRSGIRWAKAAGYECLAVMAANGKMDPCELERLFTPLITGRADYVQGSRYAPGGNPVNMPLYRQIGIRLLTSFVNRLTGFHGTDVTCGFRAYRLNLFEEGAIDISSRRMDRYELESYLHYQVLTKHFRVVEVPVSMRYPPRGHVYSKMRAGTGWWRLVRPFVLCALGMWS